MDNPPSADTALGTPPVDTGVVDKLPHFVTIVMDPVKGEQFISNIKPELRPAMLWLLKWGEFKVMTQPLTPTSPLVTPPGNGMAGLRKRLGL